MNNQVCAGGLILLSSNDSGSGLFLFLLFHFSKNCAFSFVASG